LVVDCKGADLLNQLEEIDGRVEQAGLKFALEVDVWVAGLGALDELGNINQGDDVNGELAKDGANDVDVEDFGLGTFFG
jgi:hypothetical protein